MSLSRIQSLRVAVVVEHWSQELDSLTNSLTEQLNSLNILTANDKQESARLNKLIRDCKSISQRMSQLQLELEEKQNFSSFLHSVDKEEEEKKESALIKVQEQQMQDHLLKLSMQIKDKKRKELDDDCPPLTTKSTEQLAVVKERKPGETKAIEMQLNEKKAAFAERLLLDQKELLQKKLKDEERVHVEATTFLQDQSEELKQQLEKWTQTTKQLLQEKKELLNKLGCNKTTNFDRLMEMKRKFKEMEQVVMEDREEQKKLRQEQMEARAATKVQAWWRGCMVRRGLGSFKNTGESKKGKKKKTKNKEGKKKKKK